MGLDSVFAGMELTGFLQELENGNWTWIVKRLSGNDTGLTGGHQVGIYFPKYFFEGGFPEICTTEILNPDTYVEACFLASHDHLIEGLRAIYYNNKHFPSNGSQVRINGRDEYRLTRWGGNEVPVQDAENTGAVFVFGVRKKNRTYEAICWLCMGIEEERDVEAWLGSEVEPGSFHSYLDIIKEDIAIKPYDFPVEWKHVFPKGREIFEFVTSLVPYGKKSPDQILLERREVEFKVFKQLECIEVFPKIEKGFNSIEGFLELALSVTNRRKSRTGTSLELNLEFIFKEEKLEFETQAVTENRKRPDFLFPSEEVYHNYDFPDTSIRMLAAKTCCKDRWRQVLSEADRIRKKHLFTLQEGVSENQLNEMYDSNLILVVPESRKRSFPKSYRDRILSLHGFVKDIKDLQGISD